MVCVLHTSWTSMNSVLDSLSFQLFYYVGQIMIMICICISAFSMWMLVASPYSPSSRSLVVILVQFTNNNSDSCNCIITLFARYSHQYKSVTLFSYNSVLLFEVKRSL